MKKISLVFILSALVFLPSQDGLFAQQDQKDKGSSKPNVTQKSEQLRQQSEQLNQQSYQISENVKASSENLKAVVDIFDPILRFRLRKQAKMAENGGATDPENSNQSDEEFSTEDNTWSNPSEGVTLEDIAQGIPILTESPVYNSDGSANWGSQNHKMYGCYLDMMRGQVLDDISVATDPGLVDLIFTATDYFGSAPMYALLTPAYAKNDFFANYHFRGPRYKDANIPVKQWEQVNESEVAITNLTPEQFERIQNNNQLAAVVKSVDGFKEKFESRTKIAGKVFAVRTLMDNREVYGLIYVTDQYGTTGENAYLKIKLKVTGIDVDGDGHPDDSVYKTW